MQVLADVSGALVLPPAVAFMYQEVLHHKFFPAWMSSACGGIIVAFAGSPDLAWFTGSAVSLAVAVALWWYRRRRRDPAARQFGAKSRALVAALVDRAREAAKPRRVLRPAPGGAS